MITLPPSAIPVSFRGISEMANQLKALRGRVLHCRGRGFAYVGIVTNVHGFTVELQTLDRGPRWIDWDLASWELLGVTPGSQAEGGQS